MSFKDSGVYAIVDTYTGMIYVGSSQDIFIRAERHFHMLEDKVHFNRTLQHAFDANPDGMAFVILEFTSLENRLIREQIWINRFKERLLNRQRKVLM